MTEPMDMEFLMKAADNNESLSILYKTELGKDFNYRSRFIDINPKKKFVIIDFPRGDKSTYQKLVRNDKIHIYFLSKGFRFQFHTDVLKSDNLKFEGKAERHVMIIRMPKDIYDGERRNFYRVAAPADPSVHLKFVSYFDGNQSFEQQVEHPESEDDGMPGTIAFDLSGGGLSMICKAGMGLMVGDIINMHFRLRPTDTDEIHIEGLINNSRKAAESNSYIKGVEFLPDRSESYKNALKRISRFVMQRQRAMINPYGK
ncbi:MAG: hypothetical protein GY765_26965 [bacterium]|nr:hypothetical protein [bacterium]